MLGYPQPIRKPPAGCQELETTIRGSNRDCTRDMCPNPTFLISWYGDSVTRIICSPSEGGKVACLYWRDQYALSWGGCKQGAEGEYARPL